MTESRAKMTGPITAIRRADIPEEGLQLELCWDASLLDQLPEQSSRPEIEGTLRLHLHIERDGHRVILNGRCAAQTIIACVLCLERFVFPLSLSFRCVFEPAGTGDEAGNIQLSPADMDVVFYDGEHIDLIAPVVEQIHLGLPAYPHCSPECKGLCAQCGEDLNNGACTCEPDQRPQSPFAGLARLKKKA